MKMNKINMFGLDYNKQHFLIKILLFLVYPLIALLTVVFVSFILLLIMVLVSLFIGIILLIIIVCLIYVWGSMFVGIFQRRIK